jgi:hypothetical protein
MYYMIIFVRHSVFEKELVILFYLFKKSSSKYLLLIIFSK